jgi:hypothetical protein
MGKRERREEEVEGTEDKGRLRTRRRIKGNTTSSRGRKQ